MSTIPPKEEVQDYVWDPDSRLFIKYKKITSPRLMIRKDFCVPRWEPLSQNLINRIETSEDYLFPTNYDIHGKNTSGVDEWLDTKLEIPHRAWISRERCWQIVSDIGKRIGIEVWDHWFRAQRASQLFRDYRFVEPELNAFFSWAGAWKGSGRSTAEWYTGVNVIALEEQMRLNKVRHEELLQRDIMRYQNMSKV